MRWYSLDLHIHSVLSPCSTWDMSPGKVIPKAKEIGLDMICITDHHSVRNFPAFCEAGKRLGIQVLSGIEVQSREEVHLLVYFKNYIEALRLEVLLRKHSPLFLDDTDTIKPQIVVNEEDMVKSIEKRLLMPSVNLSLEDIIALARRFETLIFLAHANRSSFSIFSQLGFIPPELDVDGVEISPRGKLKVKIPENLKVVCFSDAHALSDFEPYLTQLYLKNLNWEEIMILFKREGDRFIRRRYDVRT